MLSLLGSVASAVGKVAEIALAPVEVAVHLVDAALTPVAEVVGDLADDIKSAVE